MVEPSLTPNPSGDRLLQAAKSFVDGLLVATFDFHDACFHLGYHPLPSLDSAELHPSEVADPNLAKFERLIQITGVPREEIELTHPSLAEILPDVREATQLFVFMYRQNGSAYAMLSDVSIPGGIASAEAEGLLAEKLIPYLFTLGGSSTTLAASESGFNVELFERKVAAVLKEKLLPNSSDT